MIKGCSFVSARFFLQFTHSISGFRTVPHISQNISIETSFYWSQTFQERWDDSGYAKERSVKPIMRQLYSHQWGFANCFIFSHRLSAGRFLELPCTTNISSPKVSFYSLRYIPGLDLGRPRNLSMELSKFWFFFLMFFFTSFPQWLGKKTKEKTAQYSSIRQYCIS